MVPVVSACGRHTFTHLDHKLSTFHLFLTDLLKEKYSPAETLARALMWGHAVYEFASKHAREWISEDEADGKLRKIWLKGSVDEMRVVVRKAAVENERRLQAKQPSLALNRHGISGLPFATKVGGKGPSLCGCIDGSGGADCLLQQIWDAQQSLHDAVYDKCGNKRTDGAARLLKALQAKRSVKGDDQKTKMVAAIRGGGGLVSQRVLTYFEGSDLFDGVHDTYLPGGAGSHKALMFVAAVLGLDVKSIKVGAVLSALQLELARTNADGDTVFAAELRQMARKPENRGLHGLEDLCALLGSSVLSGGSLETLLCDVIWRLYRPRVLKCEKPRPKPWSEATSGGNPLYLFPVWASAGAPVKLYALHDFLVAWTEWKRGERDVKPNVSDPEFLR